jgi:hypothetical protein
MLQAEQTNLITVPIRRQNIWPHVISKRSVVEVLTSSQSSKQF